MSLGTLAELAVQTNGTVSGDPETRIERISAIEDVDGSALTFATDEHYLRRALASKAAAVLTDRRLGSTLDAPSKPLLLVESTREALASLLALLDRPRPRGPFVHASAVIDPSATIGADVYIGALVEVAAKAKVGARCAIEAGAKIGEAAVLGDECWIRRNATIMDGSELGRDVVVHPGSVIGSDGFGYVFIDGTFRKIPQVGNVVLEDEVEIGANTCIDRAQTGSTRIGRGTKIDNLVQIGHNCRIGKASVVASLTGLAGSTIIGDNVQVAGQVGFKGHITVGSGAIIAARSGVWGDIEPGAVVSGNPARDHREDLRREVMVRNLPKLAARVDALEGKRLPKNRP